MAIIVQSRDLYDIMRGTKATPGSNEFNGLNRDMRLHAYNGLDSAVTLRVAYALRPKLAAKPNAALSYSFVRAMQGPALAMMRRGIAVNAKVRQDETDRYLAIRQHAQRLLDTAANAVWGPEEYEETTKYKEWWIPIGKRGQPLAPRERVLRTTTTRTRPRGLNPGSPLQVLAFFNTALGCPVEHEIRKTPEGSIRTPTANNKALRKWADIRTKGPGISPRDTSVPAVQFSAPFVSLILTIRDADKMLGVLRSPLDADGRMRCSYNVVGTENGRWSSSENAFGRGTNLQNITPSMRRMFCADDSFRLISTDLEQAESRLVAGLVWASTGDDTYWRACESSDLHTVVARMSWPEMEWTNVDKTNRLLADRPYPGLAGKFSYRDVAKRIGHGSNYRGSPFGISQAIGIPVGVVADFQSRYFTAFPAIPSWHQWTIDSLAQNQYLDTPLGRRRIFFGRPDAPETIREAIAYVPQSTIGELLNLAMLRTWQRSLLPSSDPAHLPLQLLLQNHDAFLFQVPVSLPLPALLAAVKSELEIPIPLHRGQEIRALTIPGEFVTGWNWAYADPSRTTFADGNPDGLTKWRGSDDRIRQSGAVASGADWLDRPITAVYERRR